MTPKTAIILAGGKGTRLSEELPGIPKVLAPVNGMPFLHYVLEYYIAAGIEKFIFALGHYHQQVSVYLEEIYPELDMTLVVESEPLGTGGAIMQALDHCAENTVAVINGDTLFKVKIGSLAAFHHMCGAECTIALRHMTSIDRYGEVSMNKDYSIASFNVSSHGKEGLMNGGFYLLNKRLFEQHVFPEKFSFEQDYLAVKVGQSKIYGVRQEGYFIDIGVPDDYHRAQLDFKLEL